ncbi:hypothetical protein Ade02nite_01020 [Paractinoplanes deccanensis]|uniref:Hint domain-containing protein n=1 Tax=Paractinoplanes deccanensis TaxID=113561 RepID=A0ABQ3XUN1_9ACTN|nr:RHS repeat-associated core domain-containing protein [Actinoplanes deccanensis]GID71461.1 hypothetical protein Ade02nite_01020 [Actinoplanes deccanensis]
MSSTSSALSRRRRIATTLTAILVVGLLQAPAQAADPEPFTPPTPEPVPVVPVKDVPARPVAEAKQLAPASAQPAPAWPEAGSAIVDTTTTVAATADGLPVRVSRGSTQSAVRATQSGPARVRVEVLDRPTTEKAGVRGVLLRLGRADGTTAAGTATVTLDYRSFATAYGADWSSRLRLVALPACALTTPAKAQCAPQPLKSTNDAKAKTVSADVAVGASQTLIAATAAASGPAGDYAASSLSASSTWSVGGNSGSFNWSYPMRTPPGLGRPGPEVALSYSSQSVDGMHAASNNQPSWVGQGFDTTAGGFIERTYIPCADDMDGSANNDKKTGDLCWETDNATLSLAGHSGELIYNATQKLWHLRNDDGTRIQHKTGTVNGDEDDGEYWIVTTPDGLQYWFGTNRLPGWTTGKTETNSTLTVPVFGNDPNEACNASAFADSDCMQPWRWNLDYVVDPSGNSMSYWYQRDTNKYARNFDPDDAASYHRDAWLERIDYGTRRVNGVDSVFTALAPMRVDFAVDHRCLADCGTHDAVHWPDVPWDSACTGSSCPDSYTPTFWSTKRLKTVTTQVRNGASYRDVERWTLTHTFPDPGDGTRGGLWLSKLSHAGLVGGTKTVPDVEFTPVGMANRVDTIDFALAMKWMRIEKIRYETGGSVDITYSPQDCQADEPRPAPESNTRRCYPVRWIPEGKSAPVTDWFNKYVVTSIYENDNTGGIPPLGSPRVAYYYEYLDGAAWHYTDDDGLVKKNFKTWSDYRGYGKVAVRVGDGSDRTYTETRYFRGMNGDRADSAGGVKARTVDGIADDDWHAGAVRETKVFNGPGGALISRQVNTPWASGPTATRTINGDTVTARFTGTGTSTSHTTLDGGRGERTTKTVTTYDSYGMPYIVDDLGQDGVAGDERCTRTEFARNTTAWILNKPKRARSFAVACANTSGTLTEADVISETRTFYDGDLTWTAAPSKGLPTQTQEMSAWNNGTPTFLVVNKATYDDHGRIKTVSDANNAQTTTNYTPAADGPVTSTVTKNPMQHETETTLEPAWGLPVTVVDPNGKRTDIRYDALGRTTDVWGPGQTKDAEPATEKYSYDINNDAASVVSTSTLNPAGGYVTTYALFDGLLRPRQTQAPSPSGGRLLTESFYDTAGRQVLTFGTYHASGTPGGTLTSVDRAFVKRQTRTVYDGAGRVTAEVFQPDGVERWRTSTAYGGDRTDVTPPAGGTATSTVTDARGRPVQLRQYHSAAPTPQTAGSWDATTYAYDRRGYLTKVADTLGNDWVYTYDVRGRATTVDDPDKGKATLTYDNVGNVSTVTDARGKKLAYAYDPLNRKRSAYDNRIGGFERAQWIYDTVQRGYLSQSTRFVGADAYQSKVLEYDDSYQPTKTAIVIPDGETGLAGTYNYTATYNVDGSTASTGIPGTNTGLPAETLSYDYTALGQQRTLTTLYGTQNLTYINDTVYNALGEVDQIDRHLGSGGHVYTAFSREDGTRRITKVMTARDTVTPAVLSETSYEYDPAGNITKVVDAAPDPQDDTQCFTFDYLDRLTEAWTPANGDCTAAPAVTLLGGPAAYWNSWQYDKIGNRTKETVHSAAGETLTEYTHPVPGSTAVRPHAVTAVSGATNASYTYDQAGNMLTRPAPSTGTQTLTWDAEGLLESSADATGLTTYIYDAGGSRLIRRDPDGKTLYLPGQEIRYSNSTATTTCTRYYTFADSTIASRTNTGLTWLATDHQGTAQIAIAAGTLQATTRKQTPFGDPRGAASAWPNDKGFVGGTIDNTGLTHLGAREYDPQLGRFISVDPIQDLNDPQQWNAYAYANNNPITFSDPTGLVVDKDRPGCAAGNGGSCNNYVNPNNGNPSGWKSGGGSGSGSGQGSSSGFADDDDYVGKATGWENPETGDAQVCVTGFGCMDKWQITNIEAYLDAYNASVDQLVKKNGGQPLRDFQYAQAMLEACMSGENELTNCSGQAYHALNDAWSLAATAAKEGDQGVSNGNVAVAAAFAALVGYGETVTSLTGCGMRPLGGRKSFSGETRVLMADGTTKPIKDVKVGDVVLATDPRTGEEGPHSVTATWSHLDDLFTLAVNGKKLITTEDHPFWDERDGRWERADQLNPGDLLLDPANHAVFVDGFSTSERRTAAAYNLTVDGLHTYYVLAGNTPVLVHNCGTDIVKYDPDFALGQLTQGRVAKASELDSFGASQGWTRSRTANGPIKYTDENGIVRITIKRGSGRAPGSESPHVEMRNAAGERVDPYGNPVTRKSLGNHTSIDYDLP